MEVKGIAVKDKDNAGGAHVAGGQNIFEVDDKPVVVFGDLVTPHGTGLHFIPSMTVNNQHSSCFEIDGKMAIVKGNKATCGHESTGRDWFVIEE